MTYELPKIEEATYSIACKDGLYSILRNERPLKTPAGKAYSMPQEKLAEAIMAEWEAQGDKIIPASMPLTQLLATSLDIIGKDKEKTQKGLIAYIPTELLCYHAEKPEPLVEKQNNIWKPYLDWCEEAFGAKFKISTDLMPIEQDQKTIDKLTEIINGYDDMMLSGLSCATDCSGSIVLGLALVEQFNTAAEIFEACELDTKDQATRWGDDPETIERHKNMQFELDACEKWIGLLKG